MKTSRRYLLFSHDGYGLGHVRRNALVANALRHDPRAEVVVVTGSDTTMSWLAGPRTTIVRIPPLIKDAEGAYRNPDLSFEAAVRERGRRFDREIAGFRPDVVLVDRHPYGIAGELRGGLEKAKAQGASLVIGLRDILDQRAIITAEVAGRGWADVPELFDELLVYGGPGLCDHVLEYGMPIAPVYCGWVVDHPRHAVVAPELVVVTAGGGADGDAVYRLALATAKLCPERRFLFVAGPFAKALAAEAEQHRTTRAQVRVVRSAPGCSSLYARAGATVQMAGYNSTFESLAAGVRPILLPRRAPRREQAIRAGRLAMLGLADVIDDDCSPHELAWLLKHERRLPAGALEAAHVSLAGARAATDRLRSRVCAPAA